MELTTDDTGRVCTVQYADVGKVEGIIVEVDPQNKRAQVFDFPSNSLDTSVEFSQITSLGTFVTIPQLEAIGLCFVSKPK